MSPIIHLLFQGLLAIADVHFALSYRGLKNSPGGAEHYQSYQIIIQVRQNDAMIGWRSQYDIVVLVASYYSPLQMN